MSAKSKLLVSACVPGVGAVSAAMLTGDTMAMGVGFVAAIAGLLIANIIGGQLDESLKASLRVVDDLANGRYDTKGAVDSQDEAGQLAYALGNLQTALKAKASVKDVEEEPASKFDESEFHELTAKVEAIDKVQAVIEFNLDGTIIDANDNFLATLGYSLAEIQGQHHSMFVEPNFKASAEYQQFWAKLNRGEYESAEYKRLGKGGKEVWIQASYNPILDKDGKPYKVVKYATDVTQAKLDSANSSGQLEAISKAQAVIEFNLDGTIITANDNFLATLGYSLNEIQGQHHKLFVEPQYTDSVEYRQFWDKLNRGEYASGEYKRIGKGGKEIWIQASYNPIFDLNGKPFKVVKFATDITQQKLDAVENRKVADISNALNIANTSVMLADQDMNIIYANKTAMQMMTDRQNDIRKSLPDFNASKLVGSNVDIFHKTASHQRNIIGSLNEELSTDIKVSDLTFNIIANPWLDVDGNRIGTVVEWKDRTEELAQLAEQEKTASENSRIRQALDVCDTSVMMADEDMNIIYLNDAVQEMMSEAESALKTALPSFNAKGLMGFNVDNFHKNPSHQRSLLKDLRQAYKTRLPVAGLTFDLIATPLWSEDGVERLGTVVEWTNVTEQLAKEQDEARVAAENSRVRQALDRVGTNTMIADADFDIIYMNDAIEGMFRVAENDLRQDLPGFNASQLMGENIDRFHKNPAHQRGMVGALTSTFEGEIVVGGRTFGLIANPIIDDAGSRLGTVVEWNDRTAEVAIEREIDALVEAAGAGDFTKQIDLTGKEGFFRKLSEGLNTLVETTEVGLNDVIRVLGAMANGDLTERITRQYGGSFGQLKDDSNATAEKLTEVIQNIQEAANAVTSGANEITSGNADLSQRTEEQASSLEETASSMEEMTSAVRASADNATKASDDSKTTAEIASKGGQVVQNAVVAMEEINKSSKQIADIIGVIDEIAFQTNLLALNAAVEAARAGEQGRGFAVVAGEVRNLAQRSAEAAREIKDLIRDSVEKVDDGTQLVNESGETLQQIVDAVTNVSTMIQDINSAAIEQTSGIEQVNTAITQMDEMTQQNAALVEEASAAGEAMSEQARRMSDMMGFFNIGGAGGGSSQSYSAPVSRAASHSAAPSSSAPSGHSVSDDDEWEEF